MATYPDSPVLGPTYGRPVNSPPQPPAYNQRYSVAGPQPPFIMGSSYRPGTPVQMRPPGEAPSVPDYPGRPGSFAKPQAPDFSGASTGPVQRPSYLTGKPTNPIDYTNTPAPGGPMQPPSYLTGKPVNSVDYTNTPAPAGPLQTPSYLSTPYQEPINMRQPAFTAPPPFVLDQLQQPAQSTLDSQFSQFQGSQSPGKGGGLPALQRFSAAQGGYGQPAYGQYNPSSYSPPAYGQAGGKGGSGGTFGNSGKGG